VLRDVGRDAEVREGQEVGLATADLGDRGVPGLDVDVGGRRGRQHVRARLDADAAGVAGEEGSIFEVTDVVRGVTRRREHLPAEGVALGDPDPVCRHGASCPRAAERRRRVGAPRPEARRVGEGGADLGDPHRELRVLADDRPRRAGMVEMDVGEEEVADVGQLEAALATALSEPRERGGRPAVEQSRAVGRLRYVHADGAAVAEELEVDRLEHRNVSGARARRSGAGGSLESGEEGGGGIERERGGAGCEGRRKSVRGRRRATARDADYALTAGDSASAEPRPARERDGPSSTRRERDHAAVVPHLAGLRPGLCAEPGENTRSTASWASRNADGASVLAVLAHPQARS
jgi:hypothetical protein